LIERKLESKRNKRNTVEIRSSINLLLINFFSVFVCCVDGDADDAEKEQ
jgi:hypothetical protein